MALKTVFVNGVAWTSLERFLSYFIQFIIGIILARLLSPEEYGILGILLIFVNLSKVFIDSGFGNALIYFNDKKKEDISTVFVFNLIVSLTIYILLFVFSGYLESFFKINNLKLYLNVICIQLLFNSLRIVPTALLKIDFKFKYLALINSSVTIVCGLLGISLAYFGYGIWALVAQSLCVSVLSSFALMYASHFSFDFHFYPQSFRKLFNYSVNLFGASTLTNLVDETTSFVIGKYLSTYNLGIFSRARHFMMLPYNTIGSVILTVLFPSLASIKNDKKKFNDVYIKILCNVAMLTIPLYIIIGIESNNIVSIVLGEKWLDVSWVLAAMCFGRLLALCAMVTEHALNSVGRSNIYFKLQAAKMFIKLFVIIIAVQFGFKVLVVCEALFVLCQFFITNLFSYNTFKLSSINQIRLFFPYLLSSFLSCIPVFFINSFVENRFISLSLALLLFGLSYILCLFLFNQKDNLLTLYKVINK